MLMKCGHAPNGTDSKGNPVCVICIGFTEKARIVAEEPNLEGRTARCTYCGQERPSSTKLAFFEYRPDQPTDDYYCGCRGWN